MRSSGCSGSARRSGTKVRFAYADPPYVGQAKLYPEKREVDHVALIESLGAYDGWALSASSPSLRFLLPLCPETVRVMAWVKPFASFKPGVTVAYAWEPILVNGGRKRPRTKPTMRDWVSASITLKRGLVGVKPDVVCRWLFEVLGMELTDQFDDLFPGSGAVTRAYEQWRIDMPA